MSTGGNQISIKSFRALPYTMLTKAIVSFLMLASMALSIYYGRVFGADYFGNIVYEATSIIMLIVYLFSIIWLKGIEPLSCRFNTAFKVFVILCIIHCVTLILTSIELYLMRENETAVMLITDKIIYILKLLEVLIFSVAIYFEASGFADALQNIWASEMVMRILNLAKYYVAFSVFSLAVTGYSEMTQKDFSWYVVGISSLIAGLFELLIFMQFKKSSFDIWRYRTGGIRR